MKSQVLMGLLLTGFVLVGVNGCCSVNSCSNSSYGFAGADCGPSCAGGGCGGGAYSGGGCSGAGCGGGTVVGSYAPPGSCVGELGGYAGHGWGSGCFGWNSPQFFVDECGNPCFGPIAGLANMVRGAFMNASCGCGGYYVDEWISDPPLCQDPCCGACGDPCGGTCGGDPCGGGTCSGTCGGVCSSQSPAKRHLAARRGTRNSRAHGGSTAGTRSPLPELLRPTSGCGAVPTPRPARRNRHIVHPPTMCDGQVTKKASQVPPKSGRDSRLAPRAGSIRHQCAE